MQKKPLELVVSALDRNSFDKNIRVINSFIANDENVPAILVKTLLKQIQTKETYDLKKLNSKAKESLKFVLDFINRNPSYQLNWEFKGLQGGEQIEYDFGRFAQIMLHSFFQYEAEMGEKCRKDDVIWFFYEAFLEDIEADLSKTAKKKITPYMLKVLTGVFTIAAGYKLTYVANCTNKIIVGTVENAIKKKNIISK
jgi:hypothetical protein